MLSEIESDGYYIVVIIEVSAKWDGKVAGSDLRRERNVPNGTGVSLSRLPTSCPKASEVKDDRVKAKNNA